MTQKRKSEAKQKVGYEAALQRIDAESNIIWGTFNAMVTAHSFIVAAAFVALTVGKPLYAACVALALLGELICMAWFGMISRQYAYYNYWFAWARALEKDALAPEVEMVAKGEGYGRGDTVSFYSEEPVQMPWYALARIGWLAKFVIILFGLAYLALLAYSLAKIIPSC